MLKHVKWVSLGTGILLILAGFFVLNNPLDVLAGMGWFFAISMLLNGVTDLLSYFALPKEVRTWGLLTSGLLTVGFSIWLLLSGPLDWAFVIPTIFGLWILFSGIGRLVDTILITRTGLLTDGMKFILLVFAIFGAIFGFVIWMNPGLAASMAILLMAGSLIYQGVMNLLLFFRLLK